MKVFYIIISLIKIFLHRIFPPFGYQGAINAQISVYNRLKRRAPNMPENDILNRLIISRIKTPLSVTSEEEEYTHYRALVENPYKTLEDVIWAIVEYEYILSREEHIFSQLSKMGLSEPDMLTGIDDQKTEMRRHIKESIRKRVKTVY